MAGGLSLPTLLFEVLVAFTIDFERESDVSPAISANVLRILGTQGIPIGGKPTLQRSPRVAGLEPHPEDRRPSVRRPETLTHHPTVLHRGGYPDGT